jgi:hypothetical protein
MSSSLDRVPSGLSDFMKQKAKEQGTTKIELYRQVEMALKGIDTIDKILRDSRRKDEKPPFRF